MTKYTSYDFNEHQKKTGSVHPIWRGIGCILMVVIPVLSYLGATTVARENAKANWFAVPPELSKHLDLSFVWRYLPALKSALGGLEELHNFDILLTVGFLIVGFGLLAVVYSMLYSAVGPSRYGPLDAPPVKSSPKRKAYR